MFYVLRVNALCFDSQYTYILLRKKGVFGGGEGEKEKSRLIFT